ncbi:2-amino-4,5-dihydroxy-6-one-heptanoic acid-7-phosphate synthase [Glycomyces sp. TRM65418]|uniref:2-amino-3,7-dideoxy-D-threo-hept-6-ulosonate synthase n=1 Tax=Glycomyces sp. TRM65418 TaxID=2867006 RepID=UPI001CE60EA2|nr:2-amino-3,7-dideoxy-D-threo-hept-6-ulosonate synthase [Glycomyces sp. TRM65418]MCC3761594.1 2-amino-4,5-dihydroxy-6-one-heptanoic acid-7-phosphate synthase [Glycomyces sp. TRM65418]QZD55689.1 2-amino-4,5-dihydroxy-6-one-heptanoic acid-7-phosphate synthase [Glycomyces sp. TRM65418]
MGFNHYARELRLQRLHHHSDRLMIVPLDHSIADGPVAGPAGLDALVASLVSSGVDAIVVHKGSMRHIRHERLHRMSLIVHLNASTRHSPDPDAKYLVAGVEESLRLGADAVSVHVNMGSRDEARQIADLSAVAESCDRWNMPLLAMMYPRGPEITDPTAADLVIHAATLAADLGADIVKTPYVGSVQAMARITAVCPIPLVVAGGAAQDSPDGVLSYASQALSGGAAGLAMGRNIFQAKDPGRMARSVADLVHGRAGQRLLPDPQTLATAR